MGENRPELFRGRHFRDEIIVLCVRWYLRYPLSYRNLEEMMAERGLTVDPFDDRPVGAPVCAGAEPADSIRDAGSESVVAGGRNLHSRRRAMDVPLQAIDSTGSTIEFLLSPYRDLVAAKGFLQLAIAQARHILPRVINVDGHPAYPAAVEQLKQSGDLGRNCRCRCSPYMNNILEQDHRAIKRRVRASQGFRAFPSACRTLQGIETMNMIRKGQVRWLAKDDIVGQVAFVGRVLGLKTA